MIDVHVISARVNEVLSRLKPVAQSTHHSNPKCLPDTGTMIIRDINEWIEQKAGTEQILWIHGPSGIGKSRIAASVCCSLEARNILCTSFFCKWDDPELREPETVIRSLAYSLYSHHMDYRKLATSAICDGPKGSDLSFGLLHEQLVTIPLTIPANQGPTLEFTCIVIDALDQCGDSQTCRGLLLYLFNLSQNAPWLKFIVTACPNRDIQDFFDSISGSSLTRMDMCQYDVSNDIAVFVRKRMSFGLGDALQLNDSHIYSIAGSARGLFTWADIVCKIISDVPNPPQRLEAILRNSTAAEPSRQLDLLYAMVLKENGPDMNEEHALKRWLGAIVATAALPIPPPINSPELLLGEVFHSDGLATAQKVLSILYEDNYSDGHGVVQASHRSFINYITTQSRSKDFYVDTTKQNTIFSTCCLSTMLNELKFNICGLENSYMRNSDVPDLEARVSSAIGPRLRYSCLWWIDHIIRMDPMYADVALLRQLLFGRTMFYWIEALSLMNKLYVAVSQLPMLVAWTKVSWPISYDSTS